MIDTYNGSSAAHFFIDLYQRAKRLARGGECFIPQGGFVIAAGLMPSVYGGKENETRVRTGCLLMFTAAKGVIQ